MEKGQKIPKVKSADPSRNYDFLLSEGRILLEELTGNIWNDFNIHDPGITILELLCYAITDLGYRCNHSIKDIIEYDPENKGKADTLFPAESILPNNPYTVNDFRKLLINVKNIKGRGINNAYFIRHSQPYYVDCYKSELSHTSPKNIKAEHFINLNGMYDVKLEIDETITSKKDKAIVIKKAREVLNAHRNLCEDFVDIEPIKKQDFIICAEIEIDSDTDKNYLEAEIFYRVQNYLTPPVKFYSFNEMLKKGKTIDEIFEGPLLENGFIDDDELEKADLRKEIRLSDIINIIMSIKGVKAVKDILINESSAKTTLKNKWLLDVKTNYQPVLNYHHSNIVYFKEHLPLKASKVIARRYLRELDTGITSAVNEGFIKLVEGTIKNIDDYRTIQNHFPLTYGIGEAGLPKSANNGRKAQAKQLKAYLIFFEQILANYLSQLSHIKDLFTLNAFAKKTYFTKMVAGIEGFENLINDEEKFKDTIQENMESNTVFLNRRNRFLNHLLSRFAENFNEYVNTLYTYVDDYEEEDIINSKIKFLEGYPIISAIRGDGLDYTQLYGTWDTENVSGLKLRVARSLGFKNLNRRDLVKILNVNYQEVDTDNIDEYRFRIIDDDMRKILISSSGKYLEKKNADLELNSTLTLAKDQKNFDLKKTKDGRYYFNIVNENREIIARRIEYFPTELKRQEAIDYLIKFLKEKFDDEGFFVVEHILLRPRKRTDRFLPICVDPSCTQCEDADPYSFRITILLPAWSERFVNLDFRKFVEKTIRLETPAHILPKICWINQKDMSAFERSYKDWLNYIASGRGKPGVNLLNELIKSLTKMKSVYPEAILYDCRSSQSSESPFVLDKTNLGTNKK